jgi:hypothetical protein
LWNSFLDIEAVKAQFADDMCCTVKVFWSAAEYLSYNGPFCWGIEKIAENAITTTPKALNTREFGYDHVWSSVEAVHGATWCICNAVHGRKTDYWFV